MSWLAFDIGGANIKVADGGGYAAVYPFAMWTRHEHLAEELRRIVAESPSSDRLVATMTGELADCFASREQGVSCILDALQEAAEGRTTLAYANDGTFVPAPDAAGRYTELAAANWHALAQFAGRFMEMEAGLLLDVGSTTCDVVPFRDGVPIHAAFTDTERLMTGELVYTGIQRSPVCAICSRVPYRDRLCPVAQELFATAGDAYLMLRDLPEDAADQGTADGRPATRLFARARLARAICAESHEVNDRDAERIAEAIADAQSELLSHGIDQVLRRIGAPPASIVTSGHGDFLAMRAIRKLEFSARVIRLSEHLGTLVSRCATAHALAVIAEESDEP